MEGDSLKLNFEIALEKIDTLTKQNNDLLDTVDQLELQINQLDGLLRNKTIEVPTISEIRDKRFNDINKEANAAMERFTSK